MYTEEVFKLHIDEIRLDFVIILYTLLFVI